MKTTILYSVIITLFFFTNFRTFSQDLIIYENSIYTTSFIITGENSAVFKLIPAARNAIGEIALNNGKYIDSDSIKELIVNRSIENGLLNLIQFSPTNFITLDFYGSHEGFNNTSLFVEKAVKGNQFTNCYLNISLVIPNSSKGNIANLFHSKLNISVNKSYINCFEIISDNSSKTVNSRNVYEFNGIINIDHCNIISFQCHPGANGIYFNNPVNISNTYPNSSIYFEETGFLDTCYLSYISNSKWDKMSGSILYTNNSSLEINGAIFEKDITIEGPDYMYIVKSTFNGILSIKQAPVSGYIYNSNISKSLVITQDIFSNIKWSNITLSGSVYLSESNYIIEDSIYQDNFSQIKIIDQCQFYIKDNLDITNFHPTLYQIENITFHFVEGQYFSLDNDYLITNMHLNHNLTHFNRLKEYIHRYYSNGEIANAINWIDYQENLFLLKYYKENLSIKNFPQALGHWLLYITVNFGYNGTKNLIINILIWIFIYTFIYYKYLYNEAIQAIHYFSNNDKLSNIVNSKMPPISAAINMFAFALYIFVSIKIPFKVLNGRSKYTIAIAFNWITGFIYLFLYILFIVSKYQFLQGVI